jgi:hypothetical protein
MHRAAGKLPQDPARRGGAIQSSGALPPGGSGLLGSARSEEKFLDEYDPARPNEYEAVRKDKERHRKEAQEESDRQEELRLLQVETLNSEPLNSNPSPIQNTNIRTEFGTARDSCASCKWKL